MFPSEIIENNVQLLYALIGNSCLFSDYKLGRLNWENLWSIIRKDKNKEMYKSQWTKLEQVEIEKNIVLLLLFENYYNKSELNHLNQNHVFSLSIKQDHYLLWNFIGATRILSSKIDRCIWGGNICKNKKRIAIKNV